MVGVTGREKSSKGKAEVAQRKFPTSATPNDHQPTTDCGGTVGRHEVLVRTEDWASTRGSTSTSARSTSPHIAYAVSEPQSPNPLYGKNFVTALPTRYESHRRSPAPFIHPRPFPPGIILLRIPDSVLHFQFQFHLPYFPPRTGSYRPGWDLHRTEYILDTCPHHSWLIQQSEALQPLELSPTDNLLTGTSALDDYFSFIFHRASLRIGWHQPNLCRSGKKLELGPSAGFRQEPIRPGTSTVTTTPHNPHNPHNPPSLLLFFFLLQQAVIHRHPSAIGHQPSAVSHQPSAIIGHQQPFHRPSAVPDREASTATPPSLSILPSPPILE